MIAAAIGLLAALLYAARRRWVDAVLALVAGLVLAATVGEFALPFDAGVRTLRVSGDGLRAAEWDDLPARPLDWERPDTPSIRLDFPRTLALGRVFTLAVHRSWTAPGRLQVLAENGQVLAETKGDGDLTVQWLPPVAERLVVKARLLDAAGKVVDEGPVPFTVTEPAPLHVRGRFGAPSFDLRVLDDLLANSQAVIDWQVALGKGIERAETARAEMAAPDLAIVDAAWFEQAGAAARGALLGRVAGGTPLLVLGANARDAAVWTKTLQLPLAPQPANRTLGTLPPMASAGVDPNTDHAGDWSGTDGLWTRDWQQGRIAWLGVGDWHRYAIGQPRQLALWWQGVLDRLRVQRRADVEWLAPDEMPLAHQRLAVCARGVSGEVTVAELKQTLTWQRRPEQVDASCVAVWPAASGWLHLQARANEGQLYVYAPGDWPLWQRSERRDATARYAARTPAPVRAGSRPLPAWPFGVAFALAMLALWWRERR